MKLKLITSALEPTTQEFINAVESAGGPPIYTLSIPAARKVLDDLQAKPIEKLTASIEDITIPAGPRGEISLRLIRPDKSTKTLPCVIFCHGGGWILGNKFTHDRLVREIANWAECCVVFVNYAPSPEAQYPIAIEQAYATLTYMAAHGKEHQIDPSRIALAGDSVGGNMVACLAIAAKERSGPRVDLQVMFYPVTDARMNTPSYQQFADGPWLTKAAMEWFWKAYQPNAEARMHYTHSPLQASLDQLENLPPALIITDENDVLRDEGEAYAHKLMDAGVEVTAMRFLGTCHDFCMLNPLANTPACKGAVKLACAKLKSHLQNLNH